MFGKKLMKYPVLIMGMIMFGVFLTQDTTAVWWNKVKGRYIPSTCKVLSERIMEKAPPEWEFECLSTDFLLVRVFFDKEPKKKNMLRLTMYRQLANIYKEIATLANIPIEYVEDDKKKVYNEIETLERLEHIKVVLRHPKLMIVSQSDGQAVAKFLTLKRPEQIAEHLKLTVKVGEKSF